MSAMASQITSLTTVYSGIYSDLDQRKPLKLHVTGLCEGNSSVTGEFPAQRASNAENVSIWWRHRVEDNIKQNGRYLADGISKFIFLNKKFWILVELSLNFVPKGEISQHWFS